MLVPSGMRPQCRAAHVYKMRGLITHVEESICCIRGGPWPIKKVGRVGVVCVVRLLGGARAAMVPCRPVAGEQLEPSCASLAAISRLPGQPAAGVPAYQYGH